MMSVQADDGGEIEHDAVQGRDLRSTEARLSDARRDDRQRRRRGAAGAQPIGPKDATRRIRSTSDFVANRIRHSVLPPRVSREPPAEKTVEESGAA
jgi:hypothetical protein